MPGDIIQSIWINTGEISGDMHGAALMRELRACSPDLRIMGMGGPEMRALGLESFFQVEDLSVMGITEVLGHLPKILRMLKDIEKRMSVEKPTALVVIDAPDFNFRVIKSARRLGIPVYYYISPKLWAWRQSRAKFIHDNVRRMISILPFEVDFYKKFAVDVDYVGNPLMDKLDLKELDKIFPVAGRIGFLAGSRSKEVSSLMPRFATAAAFLAERLPNFEFVTARAPNISEEYLRSFWPESLPLKVCLPEDRYIFMRKCELLIAASGTAVLESALIGTPTLITYKVSPLSFCIGKLLVKVPYVGLPNLISGWEILPELLQEDCAGENLGRFALSWLKPQAGGKTLQDVRNDLAEFRKLVGEPGATRRAAEIIIGDLGTILQGSLARDY